jgi:hypothetical protein
LPTAYEPDSEILDVEGVPLRQQRGYESKQAGTRAAQQVFDRRADRFTEEFPELSVRVDDSPIAVQEDLGNWSSVEGFVEHILAPSQSTGRALSVTGARLRFL